MKKMSMIMLSIIMAGSMRAGFTVSCDNFPFTVTLDGNNVLPEAGVLFTVGVPVTGLVAGGFCGGFIGGTVGVIADSDPRTGGATVAKYLGIGTLLGALAGLYAGYCEVSAYSKVYNASSGHLDLHGAAAANDLKAIQAHFKYKNGWYLFKGNIGKPENVDGKSRTALHYAAAFNATEAAQAILGNAPEEVAKERVIGKSKVERDDIYTTGAHLGRSTATALTAHNRQAGLTGIADSSAGIYSQKTSGGAEKAQNISVDNIPYASMQDRAGNTAGHYAALTKSIEVLKALLLDGADTSIRNKNQQTIEEICQNDQALMDALNQSRGKKIVPAK